MGSYVFSVDRVEVRNCRSKGDHNDSDWLTLILKVNDSARSVGPFNIGSNVHHGDILTGPWWMGPVEINDSDSVSVIYTITNLSHDNINDQRANALKVESAILGGIVAAVGGEIGAIIGGIMAGLGELFGWIITQANPNCNGEVLHDTLTYPPGELVRQGTPHSVTNSYTAISPSECGNSPQTDLTYSVIDPHSLKQFLAMHHKDGRQGLRSILPVGMSLKTFESMHL